jgi:hypothetical protein
MTNPVRTEHSDIVVIGGGPAGICAAIAGARKNHRVLLVEKYGFLGGMATSAMFTPWRGFFSGKKKVIGGIAEEIVERLKSIGGSPGHLEDQGEYFTPFGGEYLKYALQELAVESGVTLLLHSEYIGCVKNGNAIDHILVHAREGRIGIHAPVYIDATGTGDVAVAAGARSHTVQTAASYRFSMTNVDVQSLLHSMKSNRREFDELYCAENGEFIAIGFHSAAKSWSDMQPLLQPASSIEICSDSVRGNVVVSMIPIPSVDPAEIESMTTAGMLSQTIPTVAAEFLRSHVEGFSDSRILVTPPQAGFHALRRIDGIIPVTYAKIMSGESFYDSAGIMALPGNRPSTFHISRRSMMLYDVGNLLVTGRAILPQIAMYSTNNQPASMKLGEEAGVMASRMIT